MVSLRLRLGWSSGYVLPDERFCECEDALVLDLWVGNCRDVKTTGILNVDEVLRRKRLQTIINLPIINSKEHFSSRSWLSLHQNLAEIAIREHRVADKMRFLFLRELPNSFLRLSLAGFIDCPFAIIVVRRRRPDFLISSSFQRSVVMLNSLFGFGAVAAVEEEV